MTLISLICLFALSSIVFGRSVVSPSNNGYGSTRISQVSPSSTNYAYASAKVNSPLRASVNYGYDATRNNPSSMPRSSSSDRLGAALQTAVSELERQSLLADNQFVFDFANSVTGVSQGFGGRLVSATATNFPALIGHGIAMTIAYIEPCGINLPHTHPRATEMNFAVVGTFQTGFFQENEARFIMNTVDSGKATIFPQGSVHFEQNIACEPAMFVAAFNSADPGVQTVADAFFGGLPANVIGASLGGLNITTVEALKSMLPRNAALGIEECRLRCGL